MKDNPYMENFITPQVIAPPKCSHLSTGRGYLRHLQNINSPGSKRMLKLVLDGLSLPDGGHILEIGPGCGKYAVELSLRKYEYLGLDVVRENVELWQVLKSHYQVKGDVQLMDVCKVDNICEEYDGILAVSTFEHIHDREKALQNCYNMLRPGGRLVIMDGNLLDPRLWFDMIISRPVRRKDPISAVNWLLNRERVYGDYGMGWKGKDEAVKSVFWWRRNLSGHGFRIIEATTTGFYRKWLRRLNIWPMIGMVYIVATKEKHAQ